MSSDPSPTPPRRSGCLIALYVVLALVGLGVLVFAVCTYPMRKSLENMR